MMVRFRYVWKTPDGKRNVDEVSAASKEAAFALLRERGIKAIKVEATGFWGVFQGTKKRAAVLIALVAAAVAGTVVFVGMGRIDETTGPAIVRQQLEPRRSRGVMSNVIEVKAGRRNARPLPRKWFDLSLTADKVDAVFARPSERFLARYARPGVRCGDVRMPKDVEDDLFETIDAPIVIEEADAKPVVLLKRMVAGIKVEVEIKLSNGESPDAIVAWLNQRQAMEADFRDAVIRGYPRESARRQLEVMGLKGLHTIPNPKDSE